MAADEDRYYVIVQGSGRNKEQMEDYINRRGPDSDDVVVVRGTLARFVPVTITRFMLDPE